MTFDLRVKMASEVKSKRRSWGKASKREKITIIDRMDIEDTLQKIQVEAKEIEKQEKCSKATSSSSIDLQHPELMDNETLVECLKRIKVPVPVYPDGTLSRVRLLYLFKKHVTPQPKRSRLKDRRLRWQSWNEDVKQQHDSILTEPMEIDRTTHDMWDSASDGTCNIPLSRKREPGEVKDLSPPPESKRQSLEVPCAPFSKISVSDTRTVPSPRSKTTRIIKLKRPGKSKLVQSC